MTKIEWADATWNPIVGCSVVSPGCTNCYAMRMAARIQKINRTTRMTGYVNHYDGTTQATKAGPVWTGKVALAPDRILLAPLSRRKPTRYFINSMGDLFHEAVPDAWIDRVFAVMALAPQHTFMVLTKRAKRMREYIETKRHAAPEWIHISSIGGKVLLPYEGGWPTNIWLGVSAEDQTRADERILDLLATPAAVRFVSCEPLLAPIDLGRLPFTNGDARHRYDALTGEALMYGTGVNGNPDSVIRITKPRLPRLDWVIVGGESGPGARPMHPDWAWSIRDQCVDAEIPFFFKQWGGWLPAEQDGAVIDGEQYLNCGDTAARVGKKRAGRLLDGREWNEFPEART